jgi:hypothetical protein
MGQGLSGSSKAHYRQHRATAGNNLGFRQIQYSDHSYCGVGAHAGAGPPNLGLDQLFSASEANRGRKIEASLRRF